MAKFLLVRNTAFRASALAFTVILEARDPVAADRLGASQDATPSEAAIDTPTHGGWLERGARVGVGKNAAAPDDSVSVEVPVLVGAGDIAGCTAGFSDEATAALLDVIDGTVFTAGDHAYPNGTAAEFRDCYDPTWGRHKVRTRPASGNHDYNTPGAAGYYGYFGAAAGDPARGYYSYDLAGWHVVVLNSDCAAVGGCGLSSPQGQWLQADLAAHPVDCTLAYWHRPRFSSGFHGNILFVADFWDLLYDAGADVVVNGHDHHYERFARQDPQAVPDLERGIRQFIVGTGGRRLSVLNTPAANSEVRNNATHGVLKLTLLPHGYDWEFVPIAGASFTDSGSDSCSRPNQPNEPPTATITAPSAGSSVNVGDPVAFAGTGDDAEDGDVTSSLVWTSSLDGVIGSGGSFVTSTLSSGTHVIAAQATDSGGLTGSAQTSLTINAPLVVTVMAPPNGASFAFGAPVAFLGVASDLAEGDLSASLTWTSSLDGLIGSGGSVSASALTVGEHVVTAAVTNSRGLSAFAQVVVTIRRPPPSRLPRQTAEGYRSADGQPEASVPGALGGRPQPIGREARLGPTPQGAE